MVDYEFYIVIYRGKVIVPDEWTAIEREASAMLARYKRIYTVRSRERRENGCLCYGGGYGIPCTSRKWSTCFCYDW